MGRDKKRGIAVMTKPASELIDARMVVALKETKKARLEKQKDHIFRPFEPDEHDG
jgi:hypothetical protein